MEATGFSRWFECLLAELDFELRIGDPAEIKAKRVRKPKTDKEDARLLLKLMLEDRFPKIRIPSPENRDLRQLLWHRHRLVKMRQDHESASSVSHERRPTLEEKAELWTGQGRAELEKLALAPWASRRRKELLELLDRLNPSIELLRQPPNEKPESEPRCCG